MRREAENSSHLFSLSSKAHWELNQVYNLAVTTDNLKELVTTFYPFGNWCFVFGLVYIHFPHSNSPSLEIEGIVLFSPLVLAIIYFRTTF